MAQWLQVVIAAASFLIACLVAILGILRLVNSRANRMEDKIEAVRKEAKEGHDRVGGKIDKLADDLTGVREDVAELKGRFSPLDPGPLRLTGGRGRRAS